MNLLITPTTITNLRLLYMYVFFTLLYCFWYPMITRLARGSFELLLMGMWVPKDLQYIVETYVKLYWLKRKTV